MPTSHNQRALGAMSKLPRCAPSILKTFHELAIGIKDTFEEGGGVILRPLPRDNDGRGAGCIGGLLLLISGGVGEGGGNNGGDDKK
jgi:hypothetical protein